MFGIFDLAFPKIVDPTIFVRESFIFAGNSLARRAGAFFFARNSFARRAQFSRASRGRVHPASPRRRLVQVVEIQSRQQSKVHRRRGTQVPRLPQGGLRGRQKRSLLDPDRRHLLKVSRTTTFIDLLRPRAKKGGGTWGKEKSRARGGVVSRETTATWGVRARQGVQDYRDIKIAKSLCLYKNVKFGPSNAKFAKIHKSNAKLLESNF